jgi:hypothetical protein
VLRGFETLGGTVAKINDSLLILRSMVHDCFRSLGFDSSEVLCTSHFETPKLISLNAWIGCHLSPSRSDSSCSLRVLGLRPLTNNFNNILNPQFLQTVDLIFSGMSIAEADLAYCLHFEPEMDCSERCALTFLVQATNLDNLLPLTTICDNRFLCKPRTWTTYFPLQLYVIIGSLIYGGR